MSVGRWSGCHYDLWSRDFADLVSLHIALLLLLLHPAHWSPGVLPSIGNEVLKATVAQFDAAELITQREIVSSRIREDLLKRAREFNILLDDVSLVSLTALSSSRPVCDLLLSTRITVPY